MAGERKYALDTNIFIRAFRDDAENAALQRFHAAFAPFEYLNAVVVQELRTGAKPEQAAALQRHLFDPFERRGRTIAPTYQTWKAAGEVLADLARRERGSVAAFGRGFLKSSWSPTTAATSSGSRAWRAWTSWTDGRCRAPDARHRS
jgi:predicted nucleic acid-binding protein